MSILSIWQIFFIMVLKDVTLTLPIICPHDKFCPIASWANFKHLWQILHENSCKMQRCILLRKCLFGQSLQVVLETSNSPLIAVMNCLFDRINILFSHALDSRAFHFRSLKFTYNFLFWFLWFFCCCCFIFFNFFIFNVRHS